jgi:DNA-binding PadR family transcriptional regulator
MTSQQIREILERVLTWPPSRQEEAVRLLTELEESGTSVYRLTDKQVAEVERRLADPNPKFLTLEEVREKFARRSA